MRREVSSGDGYLAQLKDRGAIFDQRSERLDSAGNALGSGLVLVDSGTGRKSKKGANDENL